jgi:hypothetical protein
MTLQTLGRPVLAAAPGRVPDARPDPVGRAVVWTAAITALGGLLLGYDTGVVSGTLLLLHDSFGISRPSTRDWSPASS